MIPGLSEGSLSMFFSKLDQQKLGSKWELGGHYSSQSKHSDVMTMCNKDLVDFGANFDVHECTMEEEAEEDIVLVMNANVTTKTDSESMDAVDGHSPVSEEEDPQPATANMTTATESQLSDMEVASEAMDLKDDHMQDAANSVVSISSEVSSTLPDVPDGLPDTFVASVPLGSMWIPDLCYPMVSLVHHSCQMAGWPQPNYHV